MCPEDQEGLDLINPNSAAKLRSVCVRRQAAPDAVAASRPGSSRLSAGILFSPAVKVQAASFPPSSVNKRAGHRSSSQQLHLDHKDIF